MQIKDSSNTEAIVAAAVQMLDFHNRASAPAGMRSTESDIRAAIRDLLISAGIAGADNIALESNRTDLRTGQCIFEVKKLIGKNAQPDQKYVEQIDRYLNEAKERGEPERLGILTDGKHWALRPSSETGKSFDTATGTRTFTIISANEIHDWVNWLSDRLDFYASDLREPKPEFVRHSFGSGLLAENEIAELRHLFEDNADDPTITVKRELWENLLGAALGEVISQTKDLDGFFVRHTYLATVTALALQASFNLDIKELAELNPAQLVDGSAFAELVNVKGVIESDFFGWPTEITHGDSWIRSVVDRVASFNWTIADYDIGSVLYQSVISATERRDLGEYYTPDWLAAEVVSATVDQPLEQRVLDPSCGSGTFLRAAIKAYVAAAQNAAATGELFLQEALVALQHKVVGIDVHPVAVHLARASWALAARDLIKAAPGVSVTVPVYLGDSLQLRSDPNTLFSTTAVTVHVDPSLTNHQEVVLEFPKALVDQVDEFDALLRKAANDINIGVDPEQTLDTFLITDAGDREILLTTLRKLKQLHNEGRNHIWAYYTRNLVRPFWLSTEEGQVDRLVGNPPWLNYNKTTSSIRRALQSQAKEIYGLWPEPRYVTHTDLAGLFYTRCVDLYLRFGGKAAMVMPHSTIGAGHYKKWRTGNWGTTNADLRTPAWDLETLQPNDFFPVPACVVFAVKSDKGGGLPTTIKQWHGSPTEPENITVTSSSVVVQTPNKTQSPYGARAFQGATIVPRRLFFVTVQPAKHSMRTGFSKVEPLYSSQDKQPWKSLKLDSLHATVPDEYVHNVHRGDTIAPFVNLDPQQVVLPFDKTSGQAPKAGSFIGGISEATFAKLPDAVQRRWIKMSKVWETNRKSTSEMKLFDRLDYWAKLTSQIPVPNLRLVYSSSGRPTATVLRNDDAIIDSKLFWIECGSLAEANYLAAIINSDTLYEAVTPLMSKGQYGPRDLQKHLWKLAIPTYDKRISIHKQLAAIGRRATGQAKATLQTLHSETTTKRRPMTARHARKTIRDELARSKVGNQIETLVQQLNI